MDHYRVIILFVSIFRVGFAIYDSSNSKHVERVTLTEIPHQLRTKRSTGQFPAELPLHLTLKGQDITINLNRRSLPSTLYYSTDGDVTSKVDMERHYGAYQSNAGAAITLSCDDDSQNCIYSGIFPFGGDMYRIQHLRGSDHTSYEIFHLANIADDSVFPMPLSRGDKPKDRSRRKRATPDIGDYLIESFITMGPIMRSEFTSINEKTDFIAGLSNEVDSIFQNLAWAGFDVRAYFAGFIECTAVASGYCRMFQSDDDSTIPESNLQYAEAYTGPFSSGQDAYLALTQYDVTTDAGDTSILYAANTDSICKTSDPFAIIEYGKTAFPAYSIARTLGTMLGITDDSSCGEGGTGKVMDIQSSPVRQEFGTGSGNSFNWTSCSAQQFTTRLASDGACLNNLAQPAYYDDDRLLGGAGTSISIDRQCQIAYGFDSTVCNVPVDPDTFCTDGISCLNSTSWECVNMFVFEGTSCNSSPGKDYWCQDGFCVLEPRTTTTTNPTTTTTTPTTTTTTPTTTTTTPTTTTTTPITTTTNPTTTTTERTTSKVTASSPTATSTWPTIKPSVNSYPSSPSSLLSTFFTKYPVSGTTHGKKPKKPKGVMYGSSFYNTITKASQGAKTYTRIYY